MCELTWIFVGGLLILEMYAHKHMCGHVKQGLCVWGGAGGGDVTNMRPVARIILSAVLFSP